MCETHRRLQDGRVQEDVSRYEAARGLTFTGAGDIMDGHSKHTKDTYSEIPGGDFLGRGTHPRLARWVHQAECIED